MLKVLVSNANMKQNSVICDFLAKDKDINLISTNDANSTIHKYFNIQPDVFILDSFYKDMSFTELIDKISVYPNEKQKCNTLLTLNKPEDHLQLFNTAKVYRIFRKPLDLENLYATITLMKEEQDIPELLIEDVYALLIQLNCSLSAKGTHYLVSAILHCYYYDSFSFSLDDIITLVSMQHNTDANSVKGAIRTAVSKINSSDLSHIKNPMLKTLVIKKDITPKVFLEILTTYFRMKNKHLIKY